MEFHDSLSSSLNGWMDYSPTTIRFSSKPLLRDFFLICSWTVSNPTYPLSLVERFPQRVVWTIISLISSRKSEKEIGPSPVYKNS